MGPGWPCHSSGYVRMPVELQIAFQCAYQKAAWWWNQQFPCIWVKEDPCLFNNAPPKYLQCHWMFFSLSRGFLLNNQSSWHCCSLFASPRDEIQDIFGISSGGGTACKCSCWCWLCNLLNLSFKVQEKKTKKQPAKTQQKKTHHQICTEGGSKNGPTSPALPWVSWRIARLHGNYLRISAVNVCFGMWAYLTDFDFAL